LADPIEPHFPNGPQAALPAVHLESEVQWGQPRGSPFGSQRNVRAGLCKSRANTTNQPDKSR
jgi:hypothetical protein